jgi:hypothetical protein
MVVHTQEVMKPDGQYRPLADQASTLEVALARNGKSVALRDSADQETVLVLSWRSWNTWLQEIKEGKFDI